MSDVSSSSEEEKLKTQQEALQEVAFLLVRGFILVIILYIVSLAFLRSRKSWFDAIAARRITYVLKTLVILALFLQLPLLYCYIIYGSPITLSEKDETYYMTFGWLRPLSVIVLLCFGLFAEMHVGPRYISLVGSIVGFFFDSVSAVRVHLYYYQVVDHGAPTGLYTKELLRYYFYRDMLSFCLLIYITLMILHLCAVIGWWQPPVINYQSIVGGEVDRLTIFQQQRNIRRMYDYRIAMAEKEASQQEMYQFQKEQRRSRKKLQAEMTDEQEGGIAVYNDDSNA